MKKPPLGFFVTGTDTEVGIGDGTKMVAEDALALWEAAGRPLSLDAVCPQKFAAPLAAPLAARAEGRTIDSKLLRARTNSSPILQPIWVTL